MQWIVSCLSGYSSSWMSSVNWRNHGLPCSLLVPHLSSEMIVGKPSVCCTLIQWKSKWHVSFGSSMKPWAECSLSLPLETLCKLGKLECTVCSYWEVFISWGRRPWTSEYDVLILLSDSCLTNSSSLNQYPYCCVLDLQTTRCSARKYSIQVG